MTAPMDCRLVGRWRIVEADPWDRSYLDLEYGRSIVFFAWAGFDEMDEVNGSGSAELLDDGTLEIEVTYHLGDEAILKAEREGFSAAC